MARDWKKIGTGITEREADVYTGKDAIPALLKSLAQWEADCKAYGGQFGAVSQHVIETCRFIVATSDPPYKPDSDADFAQRILHSYEIAKAAIERDDADAAARFAYDVGVLATQAKMKWNWERHALRGKKQLEALRKGTRTLNETRTDRAKERHAEWQEQAQEIWTRNPHLSKSDVAKKIAETYGGDWGTIRRKISFVITHSAVTTKSA